MVLILHLLHKGVKGALDALMPGSTRARSPHRRRERALIGRSDRDDANCAENAEPTTLGVVSAARAPLADDEARLDEHVLGRSTALARGDDVTGRAHEQVEHGRGHQFR